MHEGVDMAKSKTKIASKQSEMVKELLAQREAIVQYGRMALHSNDLPHILHEACRLTSEALGTEFAKVLELQDDGRMLLVVAGIGWKDGIVGHEKVPAFESSSEGFALKTGAPAVSDNINTEDRFNYAEFIKRHGVKSIMNVVIPGPDGRPPYGLLQVDSRKPRDFEQYDIEFLQGYANLVGAAIERNHYQRKLNEALSVQERMFAELQHRIQNNLTVISSLLQMKARKAVHPLVKQEISEIISSIQVLTDIYKQLYSSEKLGRIDLGGYLSSLCTRVTSFGSPQKQKVKIETKCDPLSIDAELAVPLGLVTNEFVTNSLKHAPEGHDLTISLTLSTDNNILSLQLADTGRGLGNAVDRKNREGGGSGLALIEGLLAQIKSEWEWSSRDGTELAIRLPLSVKVVQPGANH